ncbi:Ubiquinol oxidase subunit 2 [Candidatus Portiera aleyrodidarum]|uniref:Ubiquinol oxidase subunit 2 n=1 Tax=Candidatus Portiera aleyrodidarum TV TaxID=1297582 RepID=A0A8D3X7I7_9GAMM|nr:ubiquinol oxidase subunit II [Candidatus Portiera aleyrodidarum]AGI27145.1 cytochrome bo3 quinol oxidase subunit 2 [Candidatus Portiera aleyrodidarum TV]CEI59119.1 Ubiquinol oxidase subunit 2 [Candidatus Portiera aleyrodidarum]
MKKKIYLILLLILILNNEGYISILNPGGKICLEQKYLIFISTLLMLIIVIPVIFMTVYFSYKYREKKKQEYKPDWDYSKKVEVVIWGVPMMIILILGIITWKSTHELDPQKKIINNNNNLINVEVISLDWKWLFIYNQIGIATINQLVLPINVPIELKITSETVMNSFFIPQLCSQMYAMSGMKNKNFLMSNKQGNYIGMSTNFSGKGFSGMKFKVLVVSLKNFETWIKKIKEYKKNINYKILLKETINNKIEYYSSLEKKYLKLLINKGV